MEGIALNRVSQPLQATAPAAPVDKVAETREVVQAVKALNGTQMFGEDNELMFQRDRQTNRIVIRVVNRKTNEVVSQIPPEVVLRLAQDAKGEQA
jgi:uncharacterized FlaG/YvyC family protein